MPTTRDRPSAGVPLSRIVPAPLLDRSQRPALLGWLGVGLALRFAVMPFTVHADMLAVYWRANLIAHEGRVFGEYLVNMGAHYLHAASLRLLSFALPPPDEVWHEAWFFDEFVALAPQVVADFATAPHVHQTLFALKLPYLAADIVAGLILLGLVGRAGPRATRWAWAFWMLSPIGLYASYLYGRYEAFPVVFVLAALWCVERGWPWRGALLLGLAITMRGYPLLLVPLFALVAGQTRRGPRIAPLDADDETAGAGGAGFRTLVPWQAAWAATAVVPFALVMASNRLIAGTVGELARLQELPTGSTLLAYSVPVAGDGQVFPFVLFALLLYGGLAGRVWGLWGGTPVARRELWVWLFAFHVGLFALTTFSAHWFMWLTPFIALAVARRPQWRAVLPLHVLQVGTVLVIADILGGPDSLLGLFKPIHPIDIKLPSLRAALLTEPQLAEQLLGALRTAFVALSGLLAWPALRELPAGGQRAGGDGAGAPVEPADGERDAAAAPRGRTDRAPDGVAAAPTPPRSPDSSARDER